jgi:hypothetical protein
MTGEAADLAMAFAQRNLTVLFGNDARDDYESIKIAEIVRDAGGAMLVSDAYIPSVLTISASPFLMSAVQRLLALMVAKQRQLSAERAQRDSASIEFGANDVTRYLQLSALNATIPFLVHAGRNGDLSPRELYLFLIQSAGQLSTFSVDTDPSAFPPFIYTDLRSTFEELFALLTGLLARQPARAVRARAHRDPRGDPRRHPERRAHPQVPAVRAGRDVEHARRAAGPRLGQSDQDRVVDTAAIPHARGDPRGSPAGHPPSARGDSRAARGGLLPDGYIDRSLAARAGRAQGGHLRAPTVRPVAGESRALRHPKQRLRWRHSWRTSFKS